MDIKELIEKAQSILDSNGNVEVYVDLAGVELMVVDIEESICTKSGEDRVAISFDWHSS